MGLLNAIFLGIFVNLSSNFTLLNYALPVFEASGTKWNTDYAMLLMPVCQICGCIASVQLSDRLGRKCMITLSLIGGGMGLAVFAAYVRLYDANVDVSEYHWIPIAMTLFIMVMVSAGIIPLAVYATIEALPTKVR